MELNMEFESKIITKTYMVAPGYVLTVDVYDTSFIELYLDHEETADGYTETSHSRFSRRERSMSPEKLRHWVSNAIASIEKEMAEEGYVKMDAFKPQPLEGAALRTWLVVNPFEVATTEEGRRYRWDSIECGYQQSLVAGLGEAWLFCTAPEGPATPNA